MASLIAFVLRAVYLVTTIALALAAIAGFLGFAHPILDFFNHFQPLWFGGNLVALLLIGFVFPGPRMRALAMSIAATGFLASAVIFVPEAIAGWTPERTEPNGRPVYKILTHNLYRLNYKMALVAASIHEENPDIVTLQEYFPEQRIGLHRLLLADYPYFKICTGETRANIAIYAKMPFSYELGGGCLPGDNDRTARIVATFAGRDGIPFKIVTTHLDRPLQASNLIRRGSLSDELDKSVARQNEEIADLAKAIDQVPGAVLLSGDFNSTAWSYALRRFAFDTGMTRQTHNIWTYPALFDVDGWRETPAILPLDHIFTKGGIDIQSVGRTDPAGSDHYAIVATFSVHPDKP